MGIPDREHREALTRAGDAEERAYKAERERDACTREVAIAAEERHAARRERDAERVTSDRLRVERDDAWRQLREARAVIAAACAALGASATGDLAADVARITAEYHRACDLVASTLDQVAALSLAREAAEATLRETTVALERVQGEMLTLRGERYEARTALRSLLAGLSMDDKPRRDAIAEARGSLAKWDVLAARIEAPPVEAAVPHRAWNDALGVWWCDVDGCAEHLRGPQRAPVEAAVVLTPDDVRRTLAEGDACRADIEARMRRPVAPVEAAAVEARHAIGDVWCNGAGAEIASTGVEPWFGDDVLVWLPKGAGSGTPAELNARGWRRIRCAPAVGDAVRVGEGVEGVATGGDVAGEGAS